MIKKISTGDFSISLLDPFLKHKVILDCKYDIEMHSNLLKYIKLIDAQ